MKSELALLKEEIFKKIKAGEDGIIKNDAQYLFCCGLVVRYILERLPDSEMSKRGKRADFLKTFDMKMLSEKIENMVKKDYIGKLKNTHEKADHLIAEILMYEPDAERRPNDYNDPFLFGIINNTEWYSNTATIDKWQKENGYVSKSYKLPKQITEDFAAACKRADVPQAKKLSELMQKFIDEV